MTSRFLALVFVTALGVEGGLLGRHTGKSLVGRKLGSQAEPVSHLVASANNLAVAKVEEVPPLPEQGFSGPDVLHENMKTQVDDWRQEHGKRSHDEAEPAKPTIAAPKSDGARNGPPACIAVALCVVVGLLRL
uniref:Uncharacterized protein n=1 Tax=Noctiluca scintillans TaxID=2966 RepID=A0A7S1AJ95_NOCSC|mmetsp:Transcript_48286/g.127842  ORF Transcript_48286/g.127842 Transcript_48286/m.127842 type:complete len:133 (+) Transcript_48286:53-451(+)